MCHLYKRCVYSVRGFKKENCFLLPSHVYTFIIPGIVCFIIDTTSTCVIIYDTLQVEKKCICSDYLYLGLYSHLNQK